MKAQAIKHVFAINAKFLATELLVLFFMLTTVFTITVASQKVITGSESPLKIQQHPPTFFDEVKPAYNEYRHFGIHMAPWSRAMTLSKFFIAFLQRRHNFYIGYEFFHQKS